MRFRTSLFGLILVVSLPLGAAQSSRSAPTTDTEVATDTKITTSSETVTVPEEPAEYEFTADSRNADHLEIGFSVGIGVFPLVGFNSADTVNESREYGPSIELIIEGRLQHRGFFLELGRGSPEAYALGYSVYEGEEASLEILTAKLFHEIERDHVEGFQVIEDRPADFNVGFRNAYFFDDTVIQTEFLLNIGDTRQGFVGTVQIGHQKQFGNWSLYGLVGLRYFSGSILDTYFGIDEDEGTEFIERYEAEGGFMPTLRFQLSYPLSEKFVFNASTEYDEFPRSVSNSPLAQGGARRDTRIGITYIIGGG